MNSGKISIQVLEIFFDFALFVIISSIFLLLGGSLKRRIIRKTEVLAVHENSP
jgi:hypothetical protein